MDIPLVVAAFALVIVKIVGNSGFEDSGADAMIKMQAGNQSKGQVVQILKVLLKKRIFRYALSSGTSKSAF